MDIEHPMGDETRSFLEQNFPSSYVGQLQRLARALAGRKAGQVDASGLVIDAILKAARHRGQLEDPGKLKGWMKTILVREVMARLQLACYRRRQQLGEDNLQYLPDTRETVSPLQREDEAAWTKATLWRLLSLLPEQDREVICLSRVEEIPDVEVAELLDITQENLRQRRSRALHRLQKLAQEFPPE